MLCFGRYRVVRELGRGASGVVYLAMDDAAKLPVALKCMALAKGESPNEQATAQQRFRSGADLAASLHHADICAVYDVGEHDGSAWLAMELLGGCDLARYTRASRLLPDALVLQLVSRLALALDHAHRHGVLHRDVKPGNVMVDLPNDRVTLTDFGLASLVGGARTRTGIVLGSPAYMSPEQLGGSEADASGDLYSLGVMLFQLLTGRLPHDHPSLGELLRLVATTAAPDLRQYRSDLSEDLAALVAKAMHKQAHRRFGSGAELAAQLLALRAGLPRSPQPEPTA